MVFPKGTKAWCDARDEHYHDDNTSSHRESPSSTSRLNEDEEPRQSKSVKRPMELLNEGDIVKLERELQIRRDHDPSKKFRSLKSSSSDRTRDEVDATESRDGKKKKKKALAQGAKRSVEEPHVEEDVHDDTLDIEHLHTINDVTSKFHSVDEQNELMDEFP